MTTNEKIEQWEWKEEMKRSREAEAQELLDEQREKDDDEPLTTYDRCYEMDCEDCEDCNDLINRGPEK